MSLDMSTSGDDKDSAERYKESSNGISWEWKRYRSNSTSDADTPRIGTSPYHKVLIAQYDAGVVGNSSTSYATMLNITSGINQLYAHQHHFDYVLLRGIVLRTIWESPSQLPSSRATYNKVHLLEKAIEWKYDYLLLLDSDAMVYDFNHDISPSLLPDHKMILAHKVGGDNEHPKRYYNINIGVTLWNLRHAMIHTVLRRWKILCYYRIIFQLEDNDQNPLQNILRHFVTFGRSHSSTNHYLRTQIIEENHDDFAYRGGTFVKHFIRHNSKEWIQDERHRIEEISNVANDICIRHDPICNNDNSTR